MRIGKLIILLAAAALSCTFVCAQDSQSLGDVARQARQQKQQQQEKQDTRTRETPNPDTADSKASKTPHIVTNDEIPEHTGPSPSDRSPKHGEERTLPNYKEGKLSPERWRALILRQKSSIATLQSRIDTLTSSIRFAGGNYDIHEVWNERQRQKVQQVDSMRSELDQLQKQLDNMQETARRQGYGSSVYDP